MKKTLLAATIAASLGLIGCSQPENTEKSVADKAAMMDAQSAENGQADTSETLTWHGGIPMVG